MWARSGVLSGRYNRFRRVFRFAEAVGSDLFTQDSGEISPDHRRRQSVCQYGLAQ